MSVVTLVGDFNIDLLKINERVAFKDFLDSMISFGLYPSITLPTRLTDNSATLIDNIFTNYTDSNSHSSGVLILDMSDHLPYYYTFTTNWIYSIKAKPPVYNRKFTSENINKLYQELDSIEINSLMYQDIALDPNINYYILEEIISKALNNHIPLKKVKFHKYKNKRSNWITTGIIKSIKFRDNLYKTVKQTPQNTVNYFNLKQNLAVYNKILKRLIKDAKIQFYSSKFNKYRSDSKMTWNTINDILNRSKFEKQPDYTTIDDCQITDKGSIANHFNNYFGQIGTSMANSIPLVTDQTFIILGRLVPLWLILSHW